jgi:hypothetical protein
MLAPEMPPDVRVDGCRWAEKSAWSAREYLPTLQAAADSDPNESVRDAAADAIGVINPLLKRKP